MRFPRPFKGITDFEIKKPDTETILEIADKAQSGKNYSSMLALMEGSIIDGKELRSMPLVNAEYVAREAFRLYEIETKVEGVYECPACRHQNKHWETPDSDSRDDIGNLQVRSCDHDEPYVMELDKGREVAITALVNGERKTVAVLNKYVFRDPTIDDLIKIEMDKTLNTGAKRLNKLFRMILIEVDGIVDSPDLDVHSIKNRYMNDILNFPDFRDFQKISLLIRTYGLDHFIKIECENCGKNFESAVDFTGFFVSALTSQSAKRTGR